MIRRSNGRDAARRFDLFEPAACVLMPSLVAAWFALGVLPVAAQGSNAPAAPNAATTPAPQPSLPPPPAGKTGPKAQPSPVVDSIAGGSKPSVAPEAAPRKPAKPARRRLARYRRYHAPDVERPALAGVLLVEPLAPRVDPPRPIVPTPAYFVDGFVSAFTIAPPPLVCRRRPRDPDLPDPHLYREVPLVCAPDIY